LDRFAYSAPVAAATAVFLIYPIGQGSFSDGMPLGISGTFNFMIVFQAEHNILMHSRKGVALRTESGGCKGESWYLYGMAVRLTLLLPSDVPMHLRVQQCARPSHHISLHCTTGLPGKVPRYSLPDKYTLSFPLVFLSFSKLFGAYNCKASPRESFREDFSPIRSQQLNREALR
jgi:hypothetical protein